MKLPLKSIKKSLIMTNQNFSPDQMEVKREIIVHQFQNMLKKHSKPFAILIKMLMENERKEKQTSESDEFIKLKKF